MQGPERIEAGLDRIAAEVAALSALVARLATRVGALEKALPPRSVPADIRGPAPAVAALQGGRPAGGAEAEVAGPIDLSGLLAPAGRTCLVLGGAYLLRALTEAGRLPLKTGVALGFLYALAWFAAAHRAAVRQPVSGTFHGLAGVLIGLPIVWEAATRFGLLSPGASALALTVFLAGAFALVRERELPVVAGAAFLGACLLAGALAVATGRLLPFALCLIGASVAARRLSEARGWPWLEWLPAIASAIGVAGLGLRAGLTPPPDPPGAALTASLALVAATLLLVALRIRRGDAVRLFDLAQTVLAIAAGFGAAFVVAKHLGAAAGMGLAVAVLVLGALSYGAAFALLRFRRDAGLTFYYCASLGLVLLIAAAACLFQGALRDVAFTVLAAGAAWLGVRAIHPIFAAHSAAFAVAAAVSSGLVACSLAVWLGRPAAWPAFPLTGAVVLVAALPGGLIPRRAPSRALEIAASMSRLVLAIVLVATVGSLIVLAAGPAMAGTPPDPGRLATLRTIVLSAAAVALALVARLRFGGELGWLAWPALVAGGVKFVLEDFRVSTAAMLFVALAVYGTALILTSRIRRD